MCRAVKILALGFYERLHVKEILFALFLISNEDLGKPSDRFRDVGCSELPSVYYVWSEQHKDPNVAPTRVAYMSL